MAEKHEQLRILSGKSAKDLWNEDLDAFLVHWQDSMETFIAQNEKRPTQKKIGKSKARARARGSDDEDEDFYAPKAKRPSIGKKKQAKLIDVVSKSKLQTTVIGSKINQATEKVADYIESMANITSFFIVASI